MDLLKRLLLLFCVSGSVLSAEENFLEEWRAIINAPNTAITTNKHLINDSLVMAELEKHKIPYKKDFLLQIKKESGNYNSKLTKEYHNITGMKQPRRRNTLATGTNKYKHASFNSWRECIADLKMFIDFSPPKLNETFLQFMKRRGYNYTFERM